MNTDPDNQLLESYAAYGSELSFRELVERRIDLVYSAALRESAGDTFQAEDITQAVFTELARNAKKLARHPALSGWLYTCVRRMSANVRRAEHRRQRREQEAFTMNQLLSSDSTGLWQQVRPVLDDAMHQMNEEDRNAIVLRYFEGRSLKEVGVALGTSENAARRRVERSLEKLRGLLSQRGVKSTAATLATVITAGAVLTAPSSLAATVATGALAVAASSSVGVVTLAKLLGLAKTKTAAGIGLGILLATVALVYRSHSNHVASQKHQPAEARLVVADSGTVNFQKDSTGVAPTLTNGAVPKMVFRVLEAETGKPLRNTKLYLFYLYEDGRGKVTRTTTGADGKLAIDTPQAPFVGLNLFVTADGHVPKVMSWGFGRSMPAEYTMKLDQGLTIGGKVVNSQGHPVEGVRIELDDPGHESKLAENIQFGPDAVLTSDRNGLWSCNMVPKNVENVSLELTHPDYARTQATLRANTAESTNAVITIEPGLSVAGLVQDSSGNPVLGAKVREVRLNSEGERSQNTDAEGIFELRSMKAGELMLAVQAKGFAPAVQTIQVTSNVASIVFKLGPGQRLRGHIVDENGNPIPNAFVETTRRDINRVQWSTNADSEGKFEWDSAPSEPLLYSFLAEGFNPGYAVSLQADGSDHEVKLTRKQPGKDTIDITGTVRDTETGEPLDGFKVLYGRVEPDYATFYQFAATGTNGSFNWSPRSSSLRTNYQLQIELDGYLPMRSTLLSVNNGNQSLEFKLERGSGPSGIVFLPNGEPAAQAAVYLCVPRTGVTITGPARVQTGLNTTTYSTLTDNEGRFSLPPAAEPLGIVVVHDQGFAQVQMGDRKQGAAITLRPWGSIEGRVVIDSQPVAAQTVKAYGHTFGYDAQGHQTILAAFQLDAKTDSAGRFSFSKVPPGQCRLFREMISPFNSRLGVESHETSVQVEPGAVAQAVLGGAGRAVVGTVTLADATAIEWQTVPVILSLKQGADLGPYPKRSAFSSNESFIAAMKRWQQARDGQRIFGAFCEPNGSFRLPDVPAGTYRLEIKVRDSKPNSVAPRSPVDPIPEIASLAREVTVPESGEDQGAEPVDLGTLELIPQRKLTTARSQ